MTRARKKQGDFSGREGEENAQETRERRRAGDEGEENAQEKREKKTEKRTKAPTGGQCLRRLEASRSRSSAAARRDSHCRPSSVMVST